MDKKVYVQINSPYQFYVLGDELPTTETKNVIQVSLDDLQQIGITKKFDTTKNQLVEMTERQSIFRSNNNRIRDIKNRLASQDWIHNRQNREATIIAAKKQICTATDTACINCNKECILKGNAVEELTMCVADYLSLCIEQNALIKELNELEEQNLNVREI